MAKSLTAMVTVNLQLRALTSLSQASNGTRTVIGYLVNAVKIVNAKSLRSIS